MQPPSSMFVFRDLTERPWAQAWQQLGKQLETNSNSTTVLEAYSQLYAALQNAQQPDMFHAVAEALLWGDSPLAQAAMQGLPLPEGLLQGTHYDLEQLCYALSQPWQQRAEHAIQQPLPPLGQLAPDSTNAHVLELLPLLHEANSDALLTYLCAYYQRYGSGELARYRTFYWQGELRPVAYPAVVDAERFVALERPLQQLYANTEAFLAGAPAQHTLLYGARGSGKSSAVKSLLQRYAQLAMVEVPSQRLEQLPEVIELLRSRPVRYVLFIDDLSFEAGDGSYQPLKRVLEGSLHSRSSNSIVYATSNRRHLVKEAFSDRPDPLNDDVHAWDTQHERLALADRFGLLLTFPSADQRQYLDIVAGLLHYEGLDNQLGKNLDDPELRQQAIRFADWGNGYSGRSAQQFIDTLKTQAAQAQR